MVRFPNGDYLQLEMNTLISQVIYGRSWQEVATDPRFRVNILLYHNQSHIVMTSTKTHFVIWHFPVIYIVKDIPFFSNGVICRNINQLFAG